MSQLVENKWTHKLIKINELNREFNNHGTNFLCSYNTSSEKYYICWLQKINYTNN